MARGVIIPAGEIEVLLRAAGALRRRGTEVTNARLEGRMRALKASAFLAGAEAVDAAGGFAGLRFCPWERPEGRLAVEGLLAETGKR